VSDRRDQRFFGICPVKDAEGSAGAAAAAEPAAELAADAAAFQPYSTYRRITRQPGGESISDTDELGSLSSVYTA
jgi:hypothetical protein